MTYPHGGASQIWRDPATHNPSKSQIRDWGSQVENELTSLDGRASALEGSVATTEVTDALDGRLDTLEASGTVGYSFASGGPVAAATTAAITLSGEQTIDGVATSVSRVLVKDQADPAENGIYVTAAGAWARASDMDAASEIQATAVAVAEGTAHGGKVFITYSSVTTIGTDAIDWIEGPDSSGAQGQINTLNARVLDVESAVSDFEVIGHPENPLSGGAFAASASNFVFADPVVATGVLRKLRLYAANAGALEISAWTKSGDVFTKQRVISITAVAGWQELDVEMDVQAGERVGFYGANIVSYEGSPSVNDSGGWYAGAAGDTFTDASVSTTGSRMQISYEIWSIGDTTLAGLSTSQEEARARIDVLEGRVTNRASRNLFNPLSGQNLVDNYIRPSDGVPSALADYAAVGAFPVEVGKSYRLDITAALDVWEIYEHPDAVIYFYSAEAMVAGNLVDASEVGVNGVALTESNRVCTFTVPSGATHIGFTARRKSGSIDANDFEEMLTAASLTEGLGAAELVAPAMSDVAHDVIVQRLSGFLYVRCPYRPGNHVVYRVNADYDHLGMNNGVIDFDGIRLIAETEPYASTAAAWSASAVVLNNGGDASPPFKLNGMYLGGGHGIVSQKVTKTAHGKTNVDVGSSYTDGAAKSWIISQIVDADNFIVTPANTGTATAWVINGAITGSLTHASGGTNTATVAPDSTAGTQLWPIAQSYRYRAVLDGKHRVVDDGVYFGSVLQLVEEYGIPNAASVLDHLVANVGGSGDPAFDDPSIQTQIEVQTTYTWDFTGVVEVVYSTIDVQGYTVNYHGGMQMQKMIKGPNDGLTLYVPRCTTGSLATGQAEGAIGSTLYVNDEDFTDPANPPDRFWQILNRGAEKRHGFMIGYSKNAGVDRTALDVAFFTPVTSLKMYPYAVDAGMGATAVAGTLRETVGFFGAFDPNRDQDFNAKVLFRDAGKHSLYLQAPAALSGKWVGLPDRFIGQPVAATFSDGITLRSSVVASKGVYIESASGGELEIRIG